MTAMWALPCTRIERIIQTEDAVKNTAVSLKVSRMKTLAYALTKTILTVGKIAAARNTSLSPMITVYPLTFPAFLLKKSMLCVPKSSVIT
ncbi:MAG: hypothetical protein GX640_03145 [Fibrobacter sp.]|nr:hypothetical protein [Fibrobacter sp.]